MIVITGAGRTGTSLMMQTLLLLGYKTPAKKFLPEHKGIEHLNKKGYHELYHEVLEGVHHSDYKGQAVKLFPSSLNFTPKNLISKIIICKRNKKDACKSYKPLLKFIKADLSAKKAYDQAYLFLDHYIDGINHIFINFEEINSNPKKVIKELCDFLELSPSSKEFNKAIKNVDNGITSRNSNSGRFEFGIPNVPRT